MIYCSNQSLARFWWIFFSLWLVWLVCVLIIYIYRDDDDDDISDSDRETNGFFFFDFFCFKIIDFHFHTKTMMMMMMIWIVQFFFVATVDRLALYSYWEKNTHIFRDCVKKKKFLEKKIFIFSCLSRFPKNFSLSLSPCFFSIISALNSSRRKKNVF